MYRKNGREQLHSNASLLIGVGGIEPGCGVTHTCILFATYASQIKGQRVAYVEMNQSHHIQNLVKENRQQRECFRYGGIFFYPNADNRTIELVLRKGYEVVFIDFGCRTQMLCKDAPICNQRFLLASGALWRQSKLEDWWMRQERMKSVQYQYLIPLVGPSIIKALSRKYACLFQAIPFQSDPFELTPAMIQFLTKLL